MKLTTEDLKILSAPFDEKTIGIKVNNYSKDQTKAMLVAYVQHTDAYDRIEKVDPAWSSEVTDHQVIGTTHSIRVKLTIKGVTRENVGDGDDQKSATSDAIKRAAMLFGVGRYLYDVETVWVPFNKVTDSFRTFTYTDYKKALRPTQAPLPVGSSADAPAIQPPVQPKKEEPPKAMTRNEVDHLSQLICTSSRRTRNEVGAEIVKAAKAINLTTKDMKEWIDELFKKSMDKLSVPEMEQFLATLQHELGSKGA